MSGAPRRVWVQDGQVVERSDVAAIRSLDLNLGTAIEIDGSGGTYVGSNVGGELVGTTDGTAADLDNATETALAYIWDMPVIAVGASFNGFDDDYMIEVTYSEASANTIGLVAGFTSSLAGFTGQWHGAAAYRDGAGTVEFATRSSDAVKASIASGTALKQGLGVRFGSRRSIVWSNVVYWQYAYGNPLLRYLVTARTEGGAQHLDLSGITKMYPFIAFIGAGAGNIHVQKAQIRYASLDHIAAG